MGGNDTAENDDIHDEDSNRSKFRSKIEGMELLHSRLQYCDIHRYYFVNDGDATQQLSLPPSPLPSPQSPSCTTTTNTNNADEKKSLQWTQSGDLKKDPIVHVKTLIWEVTYPPPHTQSAVTIPTPVTTTATANASTYDAQDESIYEKLKEVVHSKEIIIEKLPPSSTRYIAVALRNGDRVDVNHLRSMLESERWDGCGEMTTGAKAPIILMMAERHVAERISGFVSGCIPPMCHSVPVPLFVDEALVRDIYPAVIATGDGGTDNDEGSLSSNRFNGRDDGEKIIAVYRDGKSIEDYSGNYHTSEMPLLSVGSGMPGFSLCIGLNDVLQSSAAYVGDSEITIDMKDGDDNQQPPHTKNPVKICPFSDRATEKTNIIVQGKILNDADTKKSHPPPSRRMIRDSVSESDTVKDKTTTMSIAVQSSNDEDVYRDKEGSCYIGKNYDVLIAMRARAFAGAAQTNGRSWEVQDMIEEMGDDFPLLMRVGIKINVNNGKRGVIEMEKNALHNAAWKGDIDTINLLIETAKQYRESMGEDAVNTVSTGQGNYGKSPIFYAITQCRDDVVLLLLSHGANLLIVNSKGQTPSSMSVNHLEQATCQIIFDEEEAQLQRGGSFVNYRLTHTDGKKYGDLDPRFLREGDVNLNEDTLRDIATYQSSTITDDDGVGTRINGVSQNMMLPDGQIEGTGFSGPLPRSVKQTTVWKRQQELAKKETGYADATPDDNDKVAVAKTSSTFENQARTDLTKKRKDVSSKQPKPTIVTLLSGEDIALENLDVLTLDDILSPCIVDDTCERYEYVENREGILALNSAIEESIKIMNPDTTISNNSTDLLTVKTSWGIDCEWEPSRTSVQNPVATLQLGTSNHAFVVDLQTLCQNGVTDKNTELTATENVLSETLTKLFANGSVIKVGFGISQDLAKLPASFPHLLCFQEVHSVLDLQSLSRYSFPTTSKQNMSSLRKMVAMLLKKALDKAQQCSGWSCRPLSNAQLQYAALDAAVLPALLEKMVIENLNVGNLNQDFIKNHQHVQTSYRFLYLETDDQNAYRVEMGGVKTCMNLKFVRQTWPGHKEESPPLPEKISMSELRLAAPSVERNKEKKVKNKKRITRSKANAIILSDLSGDLDKLPLPGTYLGFTKDSCIHRVFGKSLIDALPERSYLSYNRRGGVIEIANAWLLFMNFGVGKFYKKYTNKFLVGGRQLTFTMPSSHAFFQSTLRTPSIDNKVELTYNDMDIGCKPILLFIRGSTKEKFFFCGNCNYVMHAEIEDENRTDVILEVVQFDEIKRDDDQIGYLDIVALHL